MKNYCIYFTIVLIFLCCQEIAARRPLVGPQKVPPKPSASAIARLAKSGSSAMRKMIAKGPEFWDTANESIQFIKKIQELLAKKNYDVNEISDNWRAFEFNQCKPDKENEQCYSECARHSENFMWCHTTSTLSNSAWAYCSCELRDDVKAWMLIQKDLLMKKPEATLQIGEIEIVQWTLLACMTVAIFGIILTFSYQKFREAKAARAAVENVALEEHVQVVAQNVVADS